MLPEKPAEFEHGGEDSEGHGVLVEVVDMLSVLNGNVFVALRLTDLLGQLQHFPALQEPQTWKGERRDLEDYSAGEGG